MRKIKLLKDHECPEGFFKAGETIEVDEATYSWLMNVYLDERKALVQQLNAVPTFVKGAQDD
jgi:hypothetical protein